MKKLYAIVLVLAALLIVPGTASAGFDVESEAHLDGSQEVPPVVTAMTGGATVRIRDGALNFGVRVLNNTHDIGASHIHCAGPGVNGPAGVTLFTGSFTAASGILAQGTIAAPDAANGCGWADLADVAAAIANGATYVNVHTTSASGGTPSGEIRGNLPGGGFHVKSKADLDGSQEVPPVVTAMTGEAKVRIKAGELKFGVIVLNNTHDIIASHIHCAGPGVNGPVGVTLFTGSFTAASGILAQGTIAAPDAANGCGWADLADVAAAIASGATYVNVHTSSASGGTPSGEIRGQLL